MGTHTLSSESLPLPPSLVGGLLLINGVSARFLSGGKLAPRKRYTNWFFNAASPRHRRSRFSSRRSTTLSS